MTSSDFPQVLAVIPLRLASSRVPKKILADIGGQSLAQRTVGRAFKALGDNPQVRILAAVDDIATEQHLKKHYPDLTVVLTSPDIPSGTDRVFAAVMEWIKKNPQGRSSVKGVLNIQGDMPFAGVEGLRQAAGFYENASPADLQRFGMITLAQPWPSDQSLDAMSAVKVLSDREGSALYFSRYPIPYSMKNPPKASSKLPDVEFVPDMHIGLYGYTLESLAQLASHAPIELERSESLEQLRALWLGIKILVLKTHPESFESFRGIDTPADLSWARNFAKAKPKKKVTRSPKKTTPSRKATPKRGKVRKRK